MSGSWKAAMSSGNEKTMDENRSSGRKRRRRREKTGPPPPHPVDASSSPFEDATLPLLLAAAASLSKPYPRSLIKRALRSHLRLLATAASPLLRHHQLLPRGLLALLPLLLSNRSPSISSLSAEVIGTVALCSLEANTTVASDRAVIEALVRGVGSCSRLSAKAACNAVMDISTSLLGQDRLRDYYAIENLLRQTLGSDFLVFKAREKFIATVPRMVL